MPPAPTKFIFVSYNFLRVPSLNNLFATVILRTEQVLPESKLPQNRVLPHTNGI